MMMEAALFYQSFFVIILMPKTGLNRETYRHPGNMALEAFIYAGSRSQNNHIYFFNAFMYLSFLGFIHLHFDSVLIPISKIDKI